MTAGPGPAPAPVLLVFATSGGGVGRHVASLAEGLLAAGTPTTVAAPSGSEVRFGLVGTGVGFAAVDIAARPRPLRDLAAVLALRRLLAGPAVVHAHGLRAGALAVLAARTRRHRPPVVVTVHNAPVGGAGTALAQWLLERVVAGGAAAVLVVSGDLGRQLAGRGARRVLRALVPAPAPPRPVRDRRAVRAELGVPDGAALLVTVARLAPQKGLPLLLDAVEQLARRRAPAPVRAVIAGEGPLLAALQAQVRARRLGVDLLGPRQDVADLLAAADVVVVPSVWEGQPLVVQEALRLGAAVVATDVGGIREVSGDAALLVPGGDAAALAAALAAVLEDAGLRAGLRERAALRGAGLPTVCDALAQVTALYAEVTRGGR